MVVPDYNHQQANPTELSQPDYPQTTSKQLPRLLHQATTIRDYYGYYYNCYYYKAEEAKPTNY